MRMRPDTGQQQDGQEGEKTAGSEPDEAVEHGYCPFEMAEWRHHVKQVRIGTLGRMPYEPAGDPMESRAVTCRVSGPATAVH